MVQTDRFYLYMRKNKAKPIILLSKGFVAAVEAKNKKQAL